MSSPCSPDSDIADWLATIHLERYRDVFKQHGIHVARDALTLDGDHLQQLGITATGHRKRILNLAQQTRLRAQPRAGSPHPRAPPMGEDAMKAEPGAATDAFGMQQRGTMLSHTSSLEKDPSPPLVKPVPKPRTVFYRPKSEPGSAPTPPARTTAPAQSPDGAPTAFVVLEGFVPGESSTDMESPGTAAAMGTGTSRLEARLPAAPDHGQALDVSEKPFLGVPSVPPRLSHRVAVAEPSPASTPEGRPSLPGMGQGRLEMVSNVIYEGLKPSPAPTEESRRENGPQHRDLAQELTPQELTQLAEKPE